MSRKYLLFLIVGTCLILLALVLIQQPKKDIPPQSVQPLLPSTPAEPLPSPQAITYHSFTLSSSDPLSELTKVVGKDNLSTILAINRTDTKHLSGEETIILSDTNTTMQELSPFPLTLSSIETIPKIFLVSQTIQAFAAYEYGTLVRWGPVSTGKKSTPTPNGLYFTNWKGKLITSTVDDEWIMPWYFNIDNFNGISIHQYDLPGYPASHSCIRLSESDAIWFYDWAEQWILDTKNNIKLANGTPVLIFGEYQYEISPPWKQLPTKPNATTVTIEALDIEISSSLQEIKASLLGRTMVIEKV